MVLSILTGAVIFILGGIFAFFSENLAVIIAVIGSVSMFLLPIPYSIWGWKLVKQRYLLPRFMGKYLSESGLSFQSSWLQMKSADIERSLSASESVRLEQASKIEKLNDKLRSN